MNEIDFSNEFRDLMLRHAALKERVANAVEMYMHFVVSMRGKTVAIESKAGAAPSVGKGTYSAIDTIHPDYSYVVAPVEEPYPLNEKLSVIRLADLGGIFTGLM